MKITAVALSILILFGQEALASRECKGQKRRTFAEQIARLKVEGELDLIDVDLFEGGSIVAGYEYEVEPAHTNGLYSRVDRWQIGAKAIPGTTVDIGDFDVNVSGGLKSQIEASFVRFIKDPCEALLANPYSPKRIPLKARIALGPKFNVGDYFFFRGSLGFVASAEILQLLSSSAWGVGVSAGYLMEGFYKLHIVRLDETHVRLKVIAHRGQGVSGSVGLGYQNEFDVFEVRRLNKVLEKWVNTKPIKLSASLNKNNVFMVDYVLDLTDPEVIAAYETLIRKVKELKMIELIAPFKGEKNIEKSVLLDLTELEDIYRRDYQNGSVSRLKRNLRTTSEQKAYGISFDIGNKILGYEWDKSGSTSMMGVRQDNDVLDHFLLKSWGTSSQSRFLYSWSKIKSENSLNALFLSKDKDYKELRPINIVKYMSKKKNRFRFSEFQRLKMQMKKELPAEIYADIPWNSWPQGKKDKYSNYGLRYELLLAPEVIMESMSMSKNDIKVFYRDYLLSKGLTVEDFFPQSMSNGDSETSSEEMFELNLNDMAKKLEFSLDKSKPAMDRLEMFSRLKKNTLFAESGFGFIMYLRPEKMQQWYHLDLDISANEAIIDYSYGDSQLSTLYKKLLTIKAALDDDALDILREAESLSMSVPTPN